MLERLGSYSFLLFFLVYFLYRISTFVVQLSLEMTEYHRNLNFSGPYEDDFSAKRIKEDTELPATRIIENLQDI